MSEDKSQDQEQDFTLDEILAEYGTEKPTPVPSVSTDGEDGQPPSDQRSWLEEDKVKTSVVLFPTAAVRQQTAAQPDHGVTEDEACTVPPPSGDQLEQNSATKSGKIITFPQPDEEEENPILGGINRLLDAADQHAQRMFEDEEADLEVKRIEQLIPGVDEEEADDILRERRPKAAPITLPDTPPNELYATYKKGLNGLRIRMLLLFFIVLPALWLTFATTFRLPLPGVVSESAQLQAIILLGLLVVGMALSYDLLGRGIANPFRKIWGMETLIALGALATVVDGVLSLLGISENMDSLPYGAPAMLTLAFGLLGTYLRRRALCQSCRTATFSQEPYMVLRSDVKWNGRDAFVKEKGTQEGFGSQIQGRDGGQQVFQIGVPLLLVGCVVLAILASVGQSQPWKLPWCLATMLVSTASLSGLLVFALPMDALATRLAKGGTALAGWEGANQTAAHGGILMTDLDLFPPGSVTINGIKMFGDCPSEKAVGVTATLIRDSGSGLHKIFRDLLATQAGHYRTAKDLCYYEGGGLSATIRGEQIMVGNSGFMSLMEVPMPQGVKVKNAIFCAIDGELVCIFAMNYTLHDAIYPALVGLIRNKIGPVLATRDFNITPDMLRQRFKLPVQKMEYPAVERRVTLSNPVEEPAECGLVALLCREGLRPFAEAVAGAKRLRWAVLTNTALTLLGSVVGLVLTFYLTYISATAALAPENLTIFLLAWGVPTVLVSGWVNRY